MIGRLLIRALVPAAALVLTGPISLAPASAGTATWQIASVVGDPASQTRLSDVAASGPDNAWVGGSGCTDSSCATEAAIIQQWNGQSWQTVTLPDTNVIAGDETPVIGTSSADNTWIFGSDINNIGYGVHVTDSGATETAMPADGGLLFTGAAVFSPDDAWAFGFTGDFDNAIFSPYAAHYDGQNWTELPTPPVTPSSVSALSSDDLWILGEQPFEGNSVTFAAARWTGVGWQTVRIPDASGLKLPTATAF